MHADCFLLKHDSLTRWSALALSVWLLAGCAPTASPLASSIAWRQERLDRLTAPHGWLSLTALAWLNEGPQTLGAAPGNDIVLSGGPPRLGTLTKTGSRFALAVAPNVRATVDGNIVTSLDLIADDAGDPTKVEVDSLQFYVVLRGEYALRVKDSQATTRVDFAGLEYFPVCG